MASSDFDDDNLVQSYPFLASILLIFIIIFLILSLKRIFYEVPFSNDKKYKNCKCKKCIERYNNFIQYTKKENINTTFYVYLAITVICAICFAILCVKIANTKQKVFDPYEILNIPESASSKEIKKAYNKLVLKYHPDKSHEKNAKEKYMEVTSAYKALTNEKGKENYKKYGHPDGPSYMRISFAIPMFLLKGKIGGIILFSFAIFVVLILPVSFMKWFNNSKKYNDSGMKVIDQSIFYYFINRDVKLVNMPFVLGMANEFTELSVDDSQFKLIKEKVDKEYKKYFVDIDEKDKEQFVLEIPKGNYKAICALYEHSLNESKKIISEEDSREIFNKCKLLIANIINMWNECSKIKEITKDINTEEDTSDIKDYDSSTLNTIIKFSQCLHQRTNVLIENYEVLQIPYVNESHTKKIKNISSLINDSTLLKTVLSSEDEYKDAVIALNSIPQLEVEDKVKIEDFDTNTKILFITLSIKRKNNAELLNGFNHSLTYPFAIKDSLAIVIEDKKTHSVEDITFLSFEDKNETEYKHRIVCEESGEGHYAITVYPLSYSGIDIEKEIKVNIKGDSMPSSKKKNKFKGLQLDLDFFYDKYIQPIPYLLLNESHIKQE